MAQFQVLIEPSVLTLIPNNISLRQQGVPGVFRRGRLEIAPEGSLNRWSEGLCHDNRMFLMVVNQVDIRLLSLDAINRHTRLPNRVTSLLNGNMVHRFTVSVVHLKMGPPYG